MSVRAVEVPERVRRKLAARGAAGARWLRSLGELIDGLERDWELTVGAALQGGSESFIAEARTHQGTSVVLKLGMPDGGSLADEIRTLVAAGGRGYVRVLRFDEARGAMLQERLGLALGALGLPLRSQLDHLCATLCQAWTIAPAGLRLRSGVDKARWLADFIAGTWRRLGTPCPARVIAEACRFAGARAAAFDPATAVLVHGDAHAGNALQQARHGPAPRPPPAFKLVDPDGLLAEPAYDLGVLMRGWSAQLLRADPLRAGRDRCAYLSRLTGVEPQAIWEWGFVERVSTGLLLLEVGELDEGRQMLEVAGAWAAA